MYFDYVLLMYYLCILCYSCILVAIFNWGSALFDHQSHVNNYVFNLCDTVIKKQTKKNQS